MGQPLKSLHCNYPQHAKSPATFRKELHHETFAKSQGSDNCSPLACSPDPLVTANQPVVVALPHGGVVVACEIAKALHAPLEVLIVRKLGLPWQPEVAVGAIASGDVKILNHKMIEEASIPKGLIDAITRGMNLRNCTGTNIFIRAIAPPSRSTDARSSWLTTASPQAQPSPPLSKRSSASSPPTSSLPCLSPRP